MKISQLPKATEILKDIQVLDKEIIEINRFAMLIANGNTKCSFELNVEDLDKKSKEESKVSFDEDGSLMHESPLRHFQTIMRGFTVEYDPAYEFRSTSPFKKESTNSLQKEISDTSSLQILGVLLEEKESKRKSLLSELHKMGIV